MVERIYKRVDFPQPDLPTTDTKSRCFIENEISFNTWFVTGSWKYLLIFFVSRMSLSILFSPNNLDRINLTSFTGGKETGDIRGNYCKNDPNQVIDRVEVNGICFYGG